jgi:hypothetical protein
MAAGSTYTPIATTTLATATNSVTFSSISDYTDIRIVTVLASVSATTNVFVRFNSDSGTNYSYTYILGDGTASSGRQSNQTGLRLTENNDIDTSPSLRTMDIFNYASSSVYKTVLTNESYLSTSTLRSVGLWRNTAAITSINFSASSVNFAIGSIFTLYGIAAA